MIAIRVVGDMSYPTDYWDVMPYDETDNDQYKEKFLKTKNKGVALSAKNVPHLNLALFWVLPNYSCKQ